MAERRAASGSLILASRARWAGVPSESGENMASEAAKSSLAMGGPELGRDKEKVVEVFGEVSRVWGAAQGARRVGARGRPLPLPSVKVATSPKVVPRGRGRSHW